MLTQRERLSFVGAIIVFFTFVLKEGVKEHLDSVVRSVDAAVTAYSIKVGQTQIRTDLHTMKLDVISLKPFLPPNRAYPIDRGAHRMARNIYSVGVYAVDDAIKRATETHMENKEFLGKLPKDYQAPNLVVHQDQFLAAVKENFGMGAAPLMADDIEHAIRSTGWKGSLEEFAFNHTDSWEEMATNVDFAMVTEGRQAIRMGERYKTDMERKPSPALQQTISRTLLPR